MDKDTLGFFLMLKVGKIFVVNCAVWTPVTIAVAPIRMYLTIHFRTVNAVFRFMDAAAMGPGLFARIATLYFGILQAAGRIVVETCSINYAAVLVINTTFDMQTMQQFGYLDIEQCQRMMVGVPFLNVYKFFHGPYGIGIFGPTGIIDTSCFMVHSCGFATPLCLDT